MSVPGRPPPATSPPYSGLLGALHRSIAGGHASATVSLLPTLSHSGLRLPFPLLSSLARLLLIRRAAPRRRSPPWRAASSSTSASRVSSVSSLAPRSSPTTSCLCISSSAARATPAACSPGTPGTPTSPRGPAEEIFSAMPHRDLISYDAAMLTLASGGEMQEGVAPYSELRHTSPSLGYSHHTFTALLIACANLMDGDLVRQLHAHLALLGFLSDIDIASSLVDVYSKCGCIADAHKLFDEMPSKDERMWTAIVCGYGEDGQLTAAHRLFDQMPERNIFSWNALMEGYVGDGQAVEALSIFRHLIKEGVHPDQFTFSSSLSACAAIGSLKHGKQIHDRLLRTGFDPSVMIFCSLIGMYSKCGSLAGARQVFNLTGQERRDTVLWNAMLSALCHHGHGHDAIGMFVQMIRVKLKPDANTFLLVLTACCHYGLVDEGMKFFELMTERYRIVLGEDHYVCIVDLVSHSPLSCDVVEWIRSSPFGSSKRVWETFVGKCTINGNTELFGKVEEHLAEL